MYQELEEAAEVAVKGVSTAAAVATGASSLFSGLPLALLAALGVSLLAGAGGTLWYKSKFNSLEASVATDKTNRALAIVLSDERDNVLIRKLSVQLAPIVTGLNEQNKNVQIALAKVKSVAVCNNTDAARAYDSIVRPSPGAVSPR